MNKKNFWVSVQAIHHATVMHKRHFTADFLENKVIIILPENTFPIIGTQEGQIIGTVVEVQQQPAKLTILVEHDGHTQKKDISVEEIFEMIVFKEKEGLFIPDYAYWRIPQP